MSVTPFRKYQTLLTGEVVQIIDPCQRKERDQWHRDERHVKGVWRADHQRLDLDTPDGQNVSSRRWGFSSTAAMAAQGSTAKTRCWKGKHLDPCTSCLLAQEERRNCPAHLTSHDDIVWMSVACAGQLMPADWLVGMTPLVKTADQYGKVIWQRDSDGRGHDQPLCRRGINWDLMDLNLRGEFRHNLVTSDFCCNLGVS